MVANTLAWAAAALAALALLAWWPRRPRRARVIAVIDGDTLDAVLVDGRRVRIRLAGIDAPERGQAHGADARRFLQQRIGGRWVTVRLLGRDRYRRRLGVVMCNGDDVGETLLAAGLAWPLSSPRLDAVRMLRYRLAAHRALLAQHGVRRAGAPKRKPWQAWTRKLRWLQPRRRR